MSILQKILQDMFVEPELLAELDDEQKQILFCKMREEQIRRWATDEKQFEEQKKQNGVNNGGGDSGQKNGENRGVRWLMGQDGEPWVWVMGEHPGDKTIEQILEEETQDKARKLAEEEAEKLRIREEEELKEKLRQEQFEAEQERNRLEKEEQETKRQLEETLKKLKDQTLANNVASMPSVASRGGVIFRSTEPVTKVPFENDVQKVKDEFELKLRKETDKKIEEEKNRRTSEIYQTLKEARERANVEAEKEAEEEKRYWEEQEKKAREAEEQIRNIARKAREQHKMHGLRTSSSLQSLLNKDSPDSGAHNSNHLPKRDVTKLPRPAKPKSRAAIIQWYMKEELPVGAGLITGSSKVAPWFHGIISREDAEELLRLRALGAFLVRVSERIWGYTVSYKAAMEGDAKVKHFLVERIAEGYQFLGTNQLVHETLYDLITYHQNVPVTQKGQELLLEPVGQSKFPPDYQELLEFGKNVSTSSANVL